MAPDPMTPAGNAARSGMLMGRLLGGMSVFTLLVTIICRA